LSSIERILPRPAVLASLAPHDLADARRLAARVPARASAIEYRLDLAAERIEPRALLELDPRPVIATWRTTAESGSFSGSREEYARLVETAYASGATVDVEHASGLLADASKFPDRNRVVVSLHAPFDLPTDWQERLAEMRATGARAVKLVAGARDLPAALRVASLQKGQQDSSVALFPMGPASAPGRILSALFGASLVFAPIEAATAGGQVPLADLLEVYEVDRPRSIEALFGIVGSEVADSLSPLLHNTLFRARELPFLYLPLPVADYDREKPQELLFDPPFRGFSVTRPWKRKAAETAVPSEDVVVTRSANTLVFERGRWRAENTDVDGIFDPLADHDTGEGRSAVILGAGGVARAAVVATRKLGYEVLIASRRDEAADALAQELGVDSLAWSDLAETEADLYLNATPIGSSQDDPPAFPKKVLEHRPLVFDCVYRRDGSLTATIRAARAARCPTVEGVQMFAAQAIRQARLFGAEGVTAAEVDRALAIASEAA
jgi:3-dehydroquinate dehydratase/shikimate dehydrogenase